MTQTIPAKNEKDDIERQIRERVSLAKARVIPRAMFAEDSFMKGYVRALEWVLRDVLKTSAF